jgi:hypothetical protein
MTVLVLGPAEGDLEEAFDHYESVRLGLGAEFIHEFRRAVNPVLTYPLGWTSLDPVYRRCQLRRFPYGIIYGIDDVAQHIVIGAVMQLKSDPEGWRRRVR